MQACNPSSCVSCRTLLEDPTAPLNKVVGLSSSPLGQGRQCMSLCKLCQPHGPQSWQTSAVQQAPNHSAGQMTCCSVAAFQHNAVCSLAQTCGNCASQKLAGAAVSAAAAPHVPSRDDSSPMAISRRIELIFDVRRRTIGEGVGVAMHW
jgi:hypothetical protein